MFVPQQSVGDIIIIIIIIMIMIMIIIIIIIIIMCQRCLPATGHAERVHKMCGCARKSAEHYFGQRKYGEHTIVLIVCRKAGKARPFRMCVKHVWC